MKVIFLAVASLFVAGASFAAPLASVEQTGGFCRPRCPDTTLTIADDGHVSVERKVYAPVEKVEKQLVLKINPKFLEKIKRDVLTVSGAPLVDLEAGSPFCADLPKKSFFAHRGGAKLKFYEERDCHDFLTPGSPRALATELEHFLSFYNYAAP